MPSRILYRFDNRLPKLAWLARYDRAADRLDVTHGAAVECRDAWMVEGVWDGEFARGEFHRASHLFGSGVALDGDAVRFVPSCALVDRLFHCRDRDSLLVANSLIVLLAATGARLADDHDYRAEAKTILAGVDRYSDDFAVRHPRIARFAQTFYDTLVVRGAEITRERTAPRRTFATFAEYRDALHDALDAICANAHAPERRTRVTSFGTLSSGYDSTCVTALVRDLGVDRVFTYAGSWSKATQGQAEFETAEIAARLGVEPIELRAAHVPAEDPEHELRLRASSPLGQQLPLLWMAHYVERNADCAAVFTGYHGDIVWDVNVPESYTTDELKRHDVSGLDLSELRLQAGFFNVAVPFVFASSVASIAAVSRRPEMASWRLGNRYDRPISRRIVEEAGVPRHLFGMKKAGLFGTGSRPVHPALRERYFAYLDEHSIPRRLLYARAAADRAAARLLINVQRRLTGRARDTRLHRAITDQLTRFNEGESWFGRTNFRVLLYRWAVTELCTPLESAAGPLGRPLPAAPAAE